MKLTADSLLSLSLFADAPCVHNGEYDMRQSGGSVVSLSGEWEFYWDQLFLYGDFDEQLPAFGCGTYRMTLRGLTPGQKVALYIPLLSDSYSVYAKDELIAQKGTVAKTAVNRLRPFSRPQSPIGGNKPSIEDDRQGGKGF